jgi:hypothetical protein
MSFWVLIFSIYLPHQILPCKSFHSFITRWKNTPHYLEGATEQEFPFLLKVEAPWMWTVAWIIRFRTFWLFCYWECHAPHVSSMYYSFSRIYTFLLNFNANSLLNLQINYPSPLVKIRGWCCDRSRMVDLGWAVS